MHSLALIVAAVLFCMRLPAAELDSLRHAAEQGSTKAQIELSTRSRLGIGTAVNAAEAYRWAQASMNASDSMGMFNLAQCQARGLGCTTQPTKAREIFSTISTWLTQSTKASYSDSDIGNHAARLFALYEACRDGVLHIRNEEEISAEALRLASTKFHYAPAVHLIARLKLSHAISDRDSMEALALYREAADVLYVPAMIELASILSKTINTERDAFLYARKAAALGSIEAAYMCGGFLYAGVGIQRDTLSSTFWFKEAVKGASSKAAAELGYRYRHGIGVPHSEDSARLYLQIALAFNDEDSKEYLAFLHAQMDSVQLTSASIKNIEAMMMNTVAAALQRSSLSANTGSELLCGTSRRLWRRIPEVPEDSQSQGEVIAFHRSGLVRRVLYAEEGEREIANGTWTSEKDFHVLRLFIDSTYSTYAVELLSPGLVILRSSSGDRQLYEHLPSSSARRLSAFNRSPHLFGACTLSGLRTTITDIGRLRVRFTLSNIPLDGLNMGIDSVHGTDRSWDPNESAVFRAIGERTVFEDGEYSLEFNPRDQSAQIAALRHCSLTLRFGYSMDGEYRQFSVRTKEIALPQRE